jgi:hypothetical protein
MKIPLRIFYCLLTGGLLLAQAGVAQTDLAPDQNPNYAVSRDKYMKMADSINAWHGTTAQETYRAIDYLEDKREAREQRRAFRQELRMERARRGYYYYDNYYNYYRPYYYHRYPRYYSSYGYSHNWDAYYRYGLPLAVTLGWWWCR